jgi:hypothetical protein
MMKGHTMRISSVLIWALTAALGAACTSSSMMGDDDDGGGGGGGGGSGDLMPPARGFQIVSPEITIMPGQEITYCYYFKTPNTEAFTIKRWASHMTDGSHHLILFFTPTLGQPEGTISANSCSLTGGGATNLPAWIYSAQVADSDMPLPADDGNGKPVGMDVAPGQPAFLQLHYVNQGDEPLVVQAKINAEAYEAGVQTTKTFAYVTYNGDIDIPPSTNGYTETMSCNIPSTSNVWLMSTHSHKLSVKTEVRDGSSVVFTSDSWEHPGAEKWMSAPFYKFASGKLTYECTYNNPENRMVYDGDSAQTEEMCMASGYVFPASKATICYNSFVLP